MSEKPGCIHPGDPEGCIGGFMILTAAITVIFLSTRKATA